MNKKDMENIHTDPRPKDIKRGYADITKAQRILGYEPKISLKEGLTNLVNWYKKQTNFF
jgi:nucleoside-diphosphate-sugar epimerase